MVAGILTRLGLTDAISNDLGWVYTHSAAFNDLGSSAYPVDSQGSDTDAKNPGSCGKLCTAGPGWDGPSGVGTPNGVELAAVAGGGTMTTPDAGMTTTSSSQGETSTPPGSSSGAGSSVATGGGVPTGGGSGPGATSGAGAPPGGSSSGAPLKPLSLTGPLGAACTGPADCSVGNVCAEFKGNEVCTQACGGDADVGCPTGFSCIENYCFALPSAADAGADGGDTGGGSSGGCAVSSSESGFDWSGAGWLSLGLVALTARRRRAR